MVSTWNHSIIMHPSEIILAALFLIGSVLAYTEVYSHHDIDNDNDVAYTEVSDWLLGSSSTGNYC